MSDNKNNPYASAAEAYGTTSAIAGGRDLEGKVLLKSASQLEDLMNRLKKGETVPVRESGDILEYNQKLWQFFVNAMKNEEHPLPQGIKNNIATLGLFVFKRTLEVLIDTKPEKIQALIEINRNIATGLLTRPKAEAKPPAQPAGAKPAQAGKQPDQKPPAGKAAESKTDSVV